VIITLEPVTDAFGVASRRTRAHDDDVIGLESLDTSVAINQCRDGNPRPAIPVLERRLRGNGFIVPPRS